MSALAEALLAAQRQAVGSLSKAFVADTIDEATLLAKLRAIGLRDEVDQQLLVMSLMVVRTYGGEAPRVAGSNGAPREAKPASDAQWKLIRRLADERGQVAPDGPLTVDEASRVIEQLKAPA